MRLPKVNPWFSAATVSMAAAAIALCGCGQSNPTSEAVLQKAVDTMPLPKQAVEAAWEKDIREGEESNRQAMFQDAEQSFARALERAEKLGDDDPRLERTLRGLCISYVGRGKFEEAEGYQKRLLSIYEKSKDEQKAANSCLEIARALAEQKRYSEARSFYDRTLGIYERVKGGDHSNTAWVLHELGVLDELDGKDALAEPLFKRAAEIHEKGSKSGPPEVQNERFCLAMAAYTRLADSQLNQQKFDEAMPVIEKVRTMHDKHLNMLSKDQREDPTLMQSELEFCDLMQQMADHLSAKDDLKTKEEFIKEALKVKRKYFAVDDLDLTLTINSLAEVYLKRQDYKDAEPLLAEAYDIRKRICDANSWELAEVAQEYSELMRAKKDAKQEKEYEEAAFKLWPKTAFANKSPWREYLLQGTKAQQMEQWEDAASLLKKSVAQARKYGANDPRLAESLMRLAGVFSKTSDGENAEKAVKEAIAIRKKLPAFAKLTVNPTKAPEAESSGQEEAEPEEKPADS